MAAAFMLPVLVRMQVVSLREIGRLSRISLGVIGLGGLLLAALVLFPVPARLQDASAWSVYGGRVLEASDAAVSSRMNMLTPLSEAIAKSPVLGSGFGAVITYQSDDPRMHDLYRGGRVTAGAIEWQYLEIWLKLGLFGLAAIVWLWWRIGLFFWKTIEKADESDRFLVSGLMMSFLAFVAANIFTPYVNHPLGWIYLALLIIGLHVMGEGELPEHAEKPRPVPF
jgi:O-antigen ligase